MSIPRHSAPLPQSPIHLSGSTVPQEAELSSFAFGIYPVREGTPHISLPAAGTDRFHTDGGRHPPANPVFRIPALFFRSVPSACSSFCLISS